MFTFFCCAFFIMRTMLLALNNRVGNLDFGAARADANESVRRMRLCGYSLVDDAHDAIEAGAVVALQQDLHDFSGL